MFFLAIHSVNGQKKWVLAKEKNGIKVFSRYNPTGNGLKELKTVTTFKNTKLSAIFSVFKDVDNCGQWTKDVIVSKVLLAVSEQENYEYYQVFVPWPMHNRDVVYHIKYYQDTVENALHLEAKCIPNYIPEEEKVVRIKESFATWKFTPLKNGDLQVENYLFADPIGLPAWAVNIFAIESPVKVMAALKEFVKLPKHQNKTYDFIVEKN